MPEDTESRRRMRERYEKGHGDKLIRSGGQRSLKSQGLPHCCKPDIMHICLKADNNDEQKKCHFYFPSTYGFRCMEMRCDIFCANEILHQYLRGGISTGRASFLLDEEKTRIATINNRVEGYYINFPLDGSETVDDVNNIWGQLCKIGILEADFWVDKKGISGTEYGSFNVSWDDIEDGTWVPKKKELSKDILRYMEIKKRLNC